MKLCDTCIYRNNVEQLKPCIIYRDNCEYYEREEDMTREEAIICLKGIKNYGRDTFNEQSDWQNSLNMAIEALEQEQNIKSMGEDMRICREAITDEKMLIGFNMAMALCNKYLGESEDKE